ncbi:MAG TPA: YnbE family lipoprotein [Hellea balneolensis]|uniref:YnbE family lipoprotein n=1 Tax=Hellea balneolensis TaxID=287478 RepID=A0A7C5R4P2_9PROT|nr:YnbE family lipoprotein [Hellea balneolensis]
MIIRKTYPVLATTLVFAACTHTVKIEPSDKPIKIDMTVHITQEIRVMLDKPAEDLINSNPDIF